jgi:hypothetical protein
MQVDTNFEQSIETYQNSVLYDALKSIGPMDIKSVHTENWFDDFDVTIYGPEIEFDDETSWMDDLDEAA